MKSLFQKVKNKKVLLGLLVVIAVLLGWWAIYASNNRVMPQSAIYFLNDIPSPKAGDKIIVFSPHPDDETIGVGGYIYSAEKAGATVKVVLATDGNKHGLRDKRYNEFKQATGVLGVNQSNLVFLGHPDGALSKVGESVLTKEFRKEVDNFQPNIVFYPYTSDDHPDHAYTGKIAQSAISGSSISGYQYLVHANYYPQPQRYLPDDYLLPPVKLVTFDNEWQRYLLDNEAEIKLREATEQYKSQIKNPLINILFLSSIRKNEIFMTTGNINLSTK